MRALSLLLLILSACAHLGSVPPPIDVSGDWAFVPDTAPPGPRVLSPCREGHDLIVMKVVDGRVLVTGWHVTYGVSPPEWGLKLSGGWTREGLVLEGSEGEAGRAEDALRWVLEHDAARDQLVGTQLDAPLRLARITYGPPPPEGCGSGPI